ncbi:MAG TPA: hypothetical protein VFA43_17485, partial [Gemmatimonadaceae bacterium]|nr:hypothetical protein [Gemmatimonadaceae bacterium]
FGQAHGNLTAGVSGHNDVGGFGVWGEGSVGVYGQSEHAGVEGSSASVDGYGLYGKNEQGLALFLDGDAEQYPGTNGLVKALLFVDPNLPSDPIRQCFNGTVDKPYATSDDCQFSYQRLGVGEYVIGFGNELDITNRFMFVQPRTQTLVTATMFVYSSDNHSQGVVTWDPDGQPVDSAFFVVVL